MGIKLLTSTGEFAGLLNHQTVAMENGPLSLRILRMPRRNGPLESLELKMYALLYLYKGYSIAMLVYQRVVGNFKPRFPKKYVDIGSCGPQSLEGPVVEPIPGTKQHPGISIPEVCKNSTFPMFLIFPS